MEVKGAEEHITKEVATPIIKGPLQDNCSEPVFRVGIKYSRQCTFVFPGIVFPWGRNKSNDFLGESVEPRLLRVKGTEEHIGCFPQWQKYLYRTTTSQCRKSYYEKLKI